MGNILVILILLAWITGLVIYVLSLKKLHQHAKQNGLKIFDYQYDSFAMMGNSPYFLMRLWSGRLIDSHLDKKLVDRLKRSRRLLISQMCFSIGIFLLVIIVAFTGS